jgi:TolB protein
MHAEIGATAQVWTACKDLTHEVQLTAIDERDNGWAVWSPDGSRIAFDTNRDDRDPFQPPEINDVYTMDANGGDLRKLTDSIGVSGDPAYSPDGTQLAISADRGGPRGRDIYLIDAVDGSGSRRVTRSTTPGGDLAPRFSPDGKKLVFLRDGEGLFTVDLDGQNLRKITGGDQNPGDAVWSPDGKQIVFEAYPPQFPRGSVWVVDPDGSGLKDLTATAPRAADGFADPVWSPDGKRILLLQGLYPNGDPGGLAIMNRDGSDLKAVGDGHGEEHQPDWSRRSGC